MGRHSLGDERAFWRSFTLTVLKWVVLGLLPILAAIGIYRLVTSSKEPERPAAVARPSPTPDVSPTPLPSPSPSPGTEVSPSPSPAATSRGELQVLNGSGVQGQGLKAAEELEEAGYTIRATDNAVRRYEKTTVFYQPGFESMARDVARILGSNLVQQAPSSVSKSIPVTAVVGADYKP